MKRILIVQHSSALDGSAHSGLLLADGFREAGWETHVAFGFDGPIIERYATSGHETYVMPHENWLRRGRTHRFVKDVWFEWKEAKPFASLIDELSPDVVYLNTVVSLAGAVAARRRGVPCIWHLRELFSDVGGEMHAPGWARPLVRGVIRQHAQQLVANSHATARNILGKAAGAATVVPNAVRAAFFENGQTKKAAREQLDVPLERQVIGVPGTLRPMKGHPFFFRAVAPLLRASPEVMVAVTGGGEDAYVDRLKAQVETLGIDEQVQFLEWVEDMPAFYRACDVACIPSVAEPFGRTVIEAFAAETPVVATAVGGIREIVADGETGLLVAYDNDASLRDALRRCLQDRALRDRLRQKAREQAEAEYHEAIYKRRLVDLTEVLYPHDEGHDLRLET